VSASPRTRDAARSRERLLAAAEELFAREGFERTRMSDVGAAAGLSRGTPRYFFGSKEQLHRAVLERAFAARQEAAAAAFAPLRAWDGGSEDRLREALAHVAEGYLAFLLARPSFVNLLVREELTSGERLREVPRESTAMQDAFAAARDASGAEFDPDDAVLLFVSLTFSALALQPTLLAVLGRDLADDGRRARHVALVVDQLTALLRGAPASRPRARRRG
jgi:TetR/AcrR family transcriptional regulator